MKVITIHNYYQYVGGENYVFFNEKNLLREMGHNVVEFTKDNALIDKENPLNVAFNTAWSQNTRSTLRKILRETHPDVAHFHNTFLRISPSAYYACHEREIPVVQTLHNYRLLCPNALFFRDNHVCEDCLGRTPPWAGVLHACYRNSHSQTLVGAIMLTLHRWLRTWEKKVDVYIKEKHIYTDGINYVLTASYKDNRCEENNCNQFFDSFKLIK